MRDWKHDIDKDNKKINKILLGFGMLGAGLILGLIWGFSIGYEQALLGF